MREPVDNTKVLLFLKKTNYERVGSHVRACWPKFSGIPPSGLSQRDMTWKSEPFILCKRPLAPMLRASRNT